MAKKPALLVMKAWQRATTDHEVTEKRESQPRRRLQRRNLFLLMTGSHFSGPILFTMIYRMASARRRSGRTRKTDLGGELGRQKRTEEDSLPVVEVVGVEAEIT